MAQAGFCVKGTRNLLPIRLFGILGLRITSRGRQTNLDSGNLKYILMERKWRNSILLSCHNDNLIQKSPGAVSQPPPTVYNEDLLGLAAALKRKPTVALQTS